MIKAAKESAMTRQPGAPDLLKLGAQAEFLAYARQPLLAAVAALLEGRTSVEAVRAVAAAHRSLREGIAQDFEATQRGTYEDHAHEAA